MFLISLINIYYGLITYLWNVFTSVTLQISLVDIHSNYTFIIIFTKAQKLMLANLHSKHPFKLLNFQKTSFFLPFFQKLPILLFI